MNNYIIGVPSRQRSDMVANKKGIWKYFEPTNEKIKVFIREEELEEYNKYLPLERLRLVNNDINIAQKRSAIYEYAKENGFEHLFIIDDDVDFYQRDESLSSKYTNRKELLDQMDTVNNVIKESLQLCGPEFPLVGLPIKQGSHTRKYMFEKNCPIIRFVCYHMPTLISEDVKVTGLGEVFMSDRYVQLYMMDKGYSTLTNCRYAIGDLGTNYRGGCSETRTVILQSQAARALRKRFPQNVQLKVKSDGLWTEQRLDCQIFWKRFLDKEELRYLPMEKAEGKYGISI